MGAWLSERPPPRPIVDGILLELLPRWRLGVVARLTGGGACVFDDRAFAAPRPTDRRASVSSSSYTNHIIVHGRQDNVLSLIIAPDDVKMILNVGYIKQYYSIVKYVVKSMEIISFF